MEWHQNQQELVTFGRKYFKKASTDMVPFYYLPVLQEQSDHTRVNEQKICSTVVADYLVFKDVKSTYLCPASQRDTKSYASLFFTDLFVTGGSVPQ